MSLTILSPLILLSLLSFHSLPLFHNVCTSPPSNNLLYCNTKYSLSQRISNFIGQLTIPEKISMLGNKFPGIPRLNIPAYDFWSEALHGIAKSPQVNYNGIIKNSTSFPQIINMAATFNLDLISQFATIISTEGRAMSNQNQSGLDYFTPNINMDPRWGRGQETPGEDPYLTSQYVETLIKNLQFSNDDTRYYKIVADCKHLIAYDMEDSDGTDRFHFNAIVSEQDMKETFIPPFEACIKNAKVGSVMCSYNAVNGIPNCANPAYLNDLLRDQWGFDGFVVSDCGAIDDIYYTHNYTTSLASTVAVALKNGCDMDCGHFYQANAQAALDQNLIVEADLDLAISRTFGALFKLGAFDPMDEQPFTKYTPDQVASNANTDVAFEAAMESIVLLQNDGTLPLSSHIGTVALLGPHMNSTNSLQANYHGAAPFLISPLMGLRQLLPEAYILAAKGSLISGDDDSGFDEAVEYALKSDIIILCFGIDESIERENVDRINITFPSIQIDLLNAIKSALTANGLSTPIVLVVLSGSSIDTSVFSSQVSSILWAGYPGESGGLAIASVLIGDFNPSGRLPITFYPGDYVNQINMTDMGMHASDISPGRTYRFYTGTPVYPFGFGLSYSKFVYEWTEVMNNFVLTSTSISDVTVRVTNTGPFDGATVVLFFVESTSSSGEKIKTLAGFKRVFILATEEVVVKFSNYEHALYTVNKYGISEYLSGEVTLMIDFDLNFKFIT